MERFTHRWTATVSLAAALALGTWAVGHALESRISTTQKERDTLGVSLLELVALVEKHEVLIVDVRDRESAEAGRIAGAIHVGPDLDDGQVAGVKRQAAGRLVVTYCACPAEASSLRAARTLVAAGVPARALVGGYTAWVKAGGRIDRGPLRE